jgi:hypothetical protein
MTSAVPIRVSQSWRSESLLTCRQIIVAEGPFWFRHAFHVKTVAFHVDTHPASVKYMSRQNEAIVIAGGQMDKMVLQRMRTE